LSTDYYAYSLQVAGSCQLYSLVVVDEYGNGFPVAFCFSNKCDTATYKHYFQCIKNTIGIINPSIFMSENEPAFYNAWNCDGIC